MGSGAALMQISTDYVFSGESSLPWLESDQRFPVTVYGRSKSYAEDIVLSQLGNQSWIVRTAWLYSPYRRNFPISILKKLLFSEEKISVVDDQIGQPTSAKQLASLLVDMVVNNFPKGIYHGTNRGETSWFGFATALASLAGKETSRVIPISTSTHNSLAVRPRYSVLSHKGWKDSTIFTLGSWESALQEMFPKLIDRLKEPGKNDEI
jgi:dTDP-4-dehydrorhamnose reductase